MVSLAIFSASAVLPSLHSFAISSTFVRALLLASSARVPTSTLILATHWSHSLIGCCAIAGAESQTSEARAESAVIIRVIRFTSPRYETCAQLRRRSDDGAGVGADSVRRGERASARDSQAGAGLPKRERNLIRSGHLYHLGSAAATEDEQRHAADERQHTHDGRQRDRLLLVLRGRDRPDLEHFLPRRVGDPLVCERDDTEHDQKHRDDLDPWHVLVPPCPPVSGNRRARFGRVLGSRHNARRRSAALTNT